MTRLIQGIVWTRWFIGLAVLSFAVGAMPVQAEETHEPKSIRKTCGKCPEGYATTGVTEAKEICKDGDPTLVQCVPLGANLLAVCGSCPEGYREMGNSNVPARCGSQDGGRLTQCQLEKMESNLPDPTQGLQTCPPNCGSTATPGQGALPPPPKYLPTPEMK
ncbi:MAG: hypothetical protein SGJ26_11060 [Nitrospirota bacterium]|nr:hypothetical protein [Nitrospirota bacterium]